MSTLDGQDSGRPHATPGGLARLARRLSLVALMIAPLLLLEGLSSTVLFVHDFFARASVPLAERRYTQYDPELGWVGVPNVRIPDMFGRGVFFTSNARAFRGSRDVTPTVPPGRIRLVCSGDSFTQGYGVDDDHTWCALLASLDARLETVNMGQAGYGVDQAYLWYRRAGFALEHQVHLFAFIGDDFRRLSADSHGGYAKPLLRLDGEALVVSNAPLPKRSFYVPWLTENLPRLMSLRTAELFARGYRRLIPAPDPATSGAGRSEAGGAFDVGARIFEDLSRINRTKGSTLVLVYLPIRQDLGGELSPDWRAWVRRESARRGYHFIDLVDDFRRLPAQELEAMFIPKGVLTYRDAHGHYTVAANAHVARLLHERLRAIPDIAAPLG